jgi:hypothetical protein
MGLSILRVNYNLLLLLLLLLLTAIELSLGGSTKEGTRNAP